MAEPTERNQWKLYIPSAYFVCQEYNNPQLAIPSESTLLTIFLFHSAETGNDHMQHNTSMQ